MRPPGVGTVQVAKVVSNFHVHLVRHRFVLLQVRHVILRRNLEHVGVHGHGRGLVHAHQEDAIGDLPKYFIHQSRPNPQVPGGPKTYLFIHLGAYSSQTDELLPRLVVLHPP